MTGEPPSSEPVPQPPARQRINATRTRVKYIDHPAIPGLSYERLSDDLTRLFDGGKPYEYSMAHRAADLISTFHFNYFDDRRGRRDPFAIPPREFAALAREVIDQTRDLDSPTWQVVNYAHIRARGEIIGQDRRASIAQEIITKLQHDIGYRLKPDVPVDAEALRRIAFHPEELRQQMLQSIRHWTADESLHPVHAVLDALRRQDNALPSTTRDRHILNKQNMSDLERSLEAILREDRDARMAYLATQRSERKNHAARLRAEGKWAPEPVAGRSEVLFGGNFSSEIHKRIEDAITCFLFYSQPGIKPVDIDPAAFANKALELYHDSFFVRHRAFPGNLRRMHRDEAGLAQLEKEAAMGCFQPEAIPEIYGCNNKYNVYRVLASAFHKTYGYPIPHEAVMQVATGFVGSSNPRVRERLRRENRPAGRLFHEVDHARFGPGLTPKDAGAREWDEVSRRWFEDGVAGIDHGRGFLLNRLEDILGRSTEIDRRTLQHVAAEMVEHERVMAPAQRNYFSSIQQGERLLITGDALPADREAEVLTQVATALRDPASWQPFAHLYAERNQGREPSGEMMRDLQRLVVNRLSHLRRTRLGLYGKTVSGGHDPDRFERDLEETLAADRMFAGIEHLRRMPTPIVTAGALTGRIEHALGEIGRGLKPLH